MISYSPKYKRMVFFFLKDKDIQIDENLFQIRNLGDRGNRKGACCLE